MTDKQPGIQYLSSEELTLVRMKTRTKLQSWPEYGLALDAKLHLRRNSNLAAAKIDCSKQGTKTPGANLADRLRKEDIRKDFLYISADHGKALIIKVNHK